MRYAMMTAALVFSLDHALAAGPPSKWGDDPAIRDWFRSLHNSYGTSCCDVSDGSRVDDVDWKGPNEDGTYDVQYDGVWHRVEKERILHGSNRMGYAIIWRNPSVEQPYCFLPGTGS